MARGDVVRRQLLQRIARSEITLTVVYPPKVVPVASGVQTTAPLSPLTGPRPAPSLVAPAAPTPSKPPVEGVRCLWLDLATSAQLVRDRVDRIDKTRASGWQADASALVRVAVADTALDPEAPYAGTIFDDCEAVVVHGKRYRVVQVDPAGAGDRLPHTYSVWLVGSHRE